MRKLFTFLSAIAFAALASVSLPISQASAACGEFIIGGGVWSCGPNGGGGGVTGWCSLIPQSGLTHCWPFDTTYTTTSVATDPIGGSNSAQTSVTLGGASSGPSANLNNSGVFNGSSSFGQTTLANVPTTAFTLNIWVKQPTLTDGSRPMANCHTDSDNNGFEIFESSGNWDMFVGNGTTFNDVAVTPATANTWQMLTFTYDGTTITGYLNGISAGTATLTGPITGCSTSIAFGFNPAYSGDFYPGSIAGTALWNRVLTGTEITTLAGL